MTVTEVREALAATRDVARNDVARNTVQTMIVRLEERDRRKHREAGRTFLYDANRPRTVSLGAWESQMVDRSLAGSPEDMVTALIESRGLSSSEAQRIQARINEADVQ